MIPVREKEQFDPQLWDGTENSLPGKCEDGGYFLKDGAGEKFEVGGVVIRALATRKETAGRFSIYAWEGSTMYAENAWKGLKFEETHHAFYIESGTLKFLINGTEVVAMAGETAFVPAGTIWSVEATSIYAKAYVFANGGGYGESLASVGTVYEFAALPQVGEIAAWDESKLKGLEAELRFTVT